MSEVPPPSRPGPWGPGAASAPGPVPDGAGLAGLDPDGRSAADGRPPGARRPGGPVLTDPGPAAAGRAGDAYEPDPRAPGAPRPGGPRRPGGKRPRSRWRAAFFALAAVAIVVGAGWALLGNRLLVVRSVSVSGTHLLAPEQVIAAANVPVGTPLLSVDAGAVTRRVEALRQVASARVSKDWPDQLAITVTERVPVLALKMAGGGYDQLDHAGVIVRWTKVKPAALPLLAGLPPGAALAGSPAVAAAAGVLAELRPALAGQVTAVKAVTVAAGTEQVTLSLRDGKTVVWGGTDNAAQKNRELSVLLPGGARYIDVSAPGTVVTR